jgi:hypothetical protein
MTRFHQRDSMSGCPRERSCDPESKPKGEPTSAERCLALLSGSIYKSTRQKEQQRDFNVTVNSVTDSNI